MRRLSYVPSILDSGRSGYTIRRYCTHVSGLGPSRQCADEHHQNRLDLARASPSRPCLLTFDAHFTALPHEAFKLEHRHVTLRTSAPSWEIGLEIPSLLILASRVVRFSPSLVAAPRGPPTIQPACSSVSKIRARSEPSKVIDEWKVRLGCRLGVMSSVCFL